jgi:tetratricopeptide (TPR) repeat protein
VTVSPSRSPDRRESRLGWGALAAVFALALAVRLAHLAAVAGSPLQSVLVGDGRIHDLWAREIAFGEGWGDPRWYQTPTYAWFLALVHLAGGAAAAARVVQAVLGSLACACVALAAARTFDRRAGIGAGVLLALYAPAFVYDGVVDKTSLDLALLAFAIVALAPRDVPLGALRALAAGLAFGALIGDRENFVVLIPLVALAAWRSAAPTAAARARVAIALAAGLALPLGGLALQRRAITGEASLLRPQLGFNLYIGNHEGADGLYQPLVPSHGNAEDEVDEARELAEAALGRPLDVREVDDHWRDRALSWIGEHPADAAVGFARKLRLALHDTEWADTWGYLAYRDESSVAAALGSVLRFGTLSTLGALGIALAWRGGARPWFWLASMAAILAMLGAFFVLARYRAALVPFLAPFAGLALSRIPALVAGGAWKLHLPLAAAAAAIAFLPVGPLDGSRARFETSREDTWSNVAAELLRADRAEESRAAASRALALAPDNTDAAINLALAEIRLGRWASARPALERALERDPSRRADASGLVGETLASRDEIEEAERWLRAALEAEPGRAKRHARHALALRHLGRIEEAEAGYRRAIELDPRLADAHNDLGYLLELTGRRDEAREHYEAAVELDPRHAKARANLERLGP